MCPKFRIFKLLCLFLLLHRVPYLPYILPIPFVYDWVIVSDAVCHGFRVSVLPVVLALWGLLQHGFHGIWVFSFALVVMVTIEFRPFGCHGKQMKILGKAYLRQHHQMAADCEVIPPRVSLALHDRWHSRLVCAQSRTRVMLSARRITTTFLAFCDACWYSFSVYISGCQLILVLSNKRHLFTLLLSHGGYITGLK